MGLLDPPDKLEITRTVVEGHTLRLTPELEAECYKIYWRERTLGHDAMNRSWPTSKKTTPSGGKRT